MSGLNLKISEESTKIYYLQSIGNVKKADRSYRH